MVETNERHNAELRLLATYKDGPRIWDAAALFVHVANLCAARLIEPVPDSRAYAITREGLARLRE